MGLLWLLIKSTLKIAIIDSSLITLLESESPMVEGCPCNPRVGGSIPGIQMAMWLLGNNECCSAPSLSQPM